ncbi:MAG: DNA internalization-related competence protein ComEC/Rec2 [Halanaerobium sp.]|nr:DNA internalization-related competence protein ComEC/Rec2 [Halanaerobium sp.]
MGAPLLLFSWLFSLGIILAAGTGPPLLVLITTVFSIFLLLKGSLFSNRARYYFLAGMCIFLLGAGYFLLNYYQATGEYGYQAWWGEEVTLSGQVVSREEGLFYQKLLLQPEYFHLADAAQSINWGKVEVILPKGLRVEVGWVVQVTGLFVGADLPDNPGEYNQYLALLSKGISGTIKVEPADILIMKARPGLKTWLLRLKMKQIAVINECLSQPASGLLSSLLLGMREQLPEEIVGGFRKLGLSHLLALSGLHIGFLILFFTRLAGYLKLPDWLEAGLILVVISCYVLMVGASPSTVRAGATSGILIIGNQLFAGKKNYLNLLGLVFWLMVLANPYVLYSVSFQLSFSVTISIIYLLPLSSFYLEKLIPSKPLADYLALNLCVLLGVLPLQMYHFFTLSWGGVLCNFWAVPLAGGVLTLGLIGLLLGLIHQPLGIIFYYLAGLVSKLLLAGAGLFSHLPGLNIPVSRPGLWQILLFYCGLFIIGEGLKKIPFKFWPFPWKYLLTGMACLLFILLPGYGENIDQIIFLAVGQGDAACLCSAGTHFLVDCGGDYSAGFRVILPFLKTKGIGTLAGIFISHFDLDHYRYLLELLGQIEVENLFIPANCDLPTEVVQSCVSEGIGIISLEEGDTITISSLKITVLNPGRKPTGETNRDSLVLVGDWGKGKFLLPGDIDAETFLQLVGEIGKVNIIKAPHHGSDGSFLAEIYDNLKPNLVIVSTGKNVFGHPGPELLEYLRKKGIPLLRTDLDGAIMVREDGQVITYHGKKIIIN